MPSKGGIQWSGHIRSQFPHILCSTLGGVTQSQPVIALSTKLKPYERRVSICFAVSAERSLVPSVRGIACHPHPLVSSDAYCTYVHYHVRTNTACTEYLQLSRVLTAGELQVADVLIQGEAVEFHALADGRQVAPGRGRKQVY